MSGVACGAGTTATALLASEAAKGVAAETVPNTGRPGIFLAGSKSDAAPALQFRLRRSMSVPARMPEVAAHDSDTNDFNRIFTSNSSMTWTLFSVFFVQ